MSERPASPALSPATQGVGPQAGPPLRSAWPYLLTREGEGELLAGRSEDRRTSRPRRTLTRTERAGGRGDVRRRHSRSRRHATERRGHQAGWLSHGRLSEDCEGSETRGDSAQAGARARTREAPLGVHVMLESGGIWSARSVRPAPAAEPARLPSARESEVRSIPSSCGDRCRRNRAAGSDRHDP